ncbi:hypothetical protein [Mesorhizobium comanense]|uniref:hypothetical protein n=1 Tax=Mesorhizobium comanense TaxID=2502215 RepID=UPI0010F87234|nr:hypothetical protein [Mesorhizobium comanense]
MDGWKNNSSLEPQPFEYATLEYRSNGPQAGKLFDTRQADAIVGRLNELVGQHRPILLVIFAHGWHHNAYENHDPAKADNIEATGDRPYNQNLNLLAFKHILAKANYESRAQGEPPRTVFGIYIGWNGGPASSYLNAARIGRAADRIGASEDFAADMKRINLAVNPPGGVITPVLAIGHSFGGRLLSRYMLKQVEKAKGPVQPFGPRGLVATVNPAIGADAFDDLMRAGHQDGPDLPYWINVTSADDWATGIVLPVAASLGRAVGFEIGITDKVFSSSAYRSIGHYDPYLTHRLEMPYVRAAKKCTDTSGCFEFQGCFISNLEKKWQAYFAAAGADIRQTQWYRIDSGKQEKVSRLFYLGKTTQCDSRFYFVDLKSVPPRQDYPGMPRWMWNIRTDKVGINTSDATNDCLPKVDDGREGCDKKTSAAVHNAFVQTRFVRMFLELVLAKPGA